jgi:Peptidase A4 family/ell wall binding domain 2 (CWB2)/Putative Ig domain
VKKPSLVTERPIGPRLTRILAGLGFVAFLGMFLTMISVTSAAAAVSVQRIYGTDAIGTSIAVSQAEFPANGSAQAVVLARSDFFSDALAGGPLAARVGGPLLITPGASLSTSLDPRVQAEIQRVLPVGRTVYILGGDLALSPDIDATLEGLGYPVVREGGADEYATAVDIAEALGNPRTIFEATGLAFPDALSAVPAAIAANGAILLTDGPTQSPETAAYLAAHPSDFRYAIGGPLAAAGADPTATPVYGQDLYGTSAAVASTFFPLTRTFGAATGAEFPDALSGGVFMGAPATNGPVLLVPPSGSLPPTIASYLSGVKSTVQQGYLFGGPLAVGDDVLAQLEAPGSTPPSASSLAVVVSTLPVGTVATPYSTTLSALGGVLPYTWAVTAGSLPTGLSLSASGVITGTPSSPGNFSFTVQVTDATTPTPLTATQTESILVTPVSVPVVSTAGWSGYSISGNVPFTFVSGTFSVPGLASETPVADEFSEWVGIDGLSLSSVIQAGISESFDPSNPNLFYIQPWWQVSPASTPVPITSVAVAVGDEITVTIGQVSGSEWGITLTDDTNGESFTTDQTYTGPGSSVEWIVEAPTVSGATTTLAPYSPAVTFSDLRLGGTETALTEFVMTQAGIQVSTPSALTGNGFNVAYGSVAPPAP